MAETKRALIQRETNSAVDPQEFTQTDEAQDSSFPPAEMSGEESSGPTYEEIAVRAYECWQERGGTHGASEDDWYRAEQELRKEHARVGHQTRSAAASA